MSIRLFMLSAPYSEFSPCLRQIFEFDEQYGCRFITLKYIYRKSKNGSVEKGTRKKY